MSAKRSGFTMTELLIVIGIVSVLVGLGIMLIAGVRDAQQRVRNVNHLKQISTAVHAYHDAHKRLPPATGTNSDIIGGTNRSLSVHMLPYIEQLPLYQKYTTTNNVPLEFISTFHAPLDPTTPDFIGVQNFAGNVRIFTDVGAKTSFNVPVIGLHANNGKCTATLKDGFPDGTSNTIMFATRYANGGTITSGGTVSCSAYASLVGSNNSAFFGVAPMTSPVSATSAGGWQLAPNLTQVNCQFGVVAHSFGQHGLHVALVDASVRMVTPDMSPFTWNSAMQPNDGNAPGSDW